MNCAASELSAHKLPRVYSGALHGGDTWHRDGMRVVVIYSVSSDSLIARFDTMIDGEHWNCGFDSADSAINRRLSSGLVPKEFGQLCEAAAKRAFLEGKAGKGRVLLILKLSDFE